MKLYHVVSTYGPSSTVYPKPQKISSISSRIWLIRCCVPGEKRLPGSVTSQASAAMRFSISSAASSSRRALMLASTRVRTSLASLPIAGRSSGVSLPMECIIAVSLPFLPSTETRRASSASRSVAAASPSVTWASMVLRSSDIDIVSSLLDKKTVLAQPCCCPRTD